MTDGRRRPVPARPDRGRAGENEAAAAPAPSPASPPLPAPLLIDGVDRHMLRELQDDARITNVELARRVGVSAPPCLRRMRRLEEAGIVRGYSADVDGTLVGWPITFFALVGLESQKEASLGAFERAVGRWPEVRECHMIRGGGDFLLRIVARDHAHENRLTEALTGLDLVARVQTLQTIRTGHRLPGLPL